MSRRRIAVIVASVLLMVGFAAGGYALGAAGAPTEADAAAERERAELIGSILGRAETLRIGLNRGFQSGLAEGQTDGELAGMAEGESAGELSVSRKLPDRAGGGNDDFDLAPLPGDGGVLVVGDSLEVSTGPALEKYLSGIPLTHNAVVGYNSYQIFDLLQESYDPSQSVIVFDAGTNDSPSSPEILAGNLQAVTEVIGDRCMVVPTVHSPPVDGVGDEGRNNVVLEFAASRPGTQTPDWAGLVQENPELLGPDNLHPVAEGVDLRAQLIAEGVRACLDGGSGF